MSNALKDVNCKRTILDLVKSNLGNKGVENFVCSMEETKALNTCVVLFKMPIIPHNNRLIDSGATHLSDALKHGNWKLTTLFKSNDRLIDSKVAHLSDALNDSYCKLALLCLSNNRLIDSGTAHLSDALKHDNCKLKVLYLSNNRLVDSGAAHLSDELKHGNCKLALFTSVIIV